jgi:hypothetical protein
MMLVPIEPTESMIDAIAYTIYEDVGSRQVYLAMLAAAPKKIEYESDEFTEPKKEKAE